MSQAEVGNQASRLQVSGPISQVNDYFYDQGWTDGLPIVPPTEDLVLEMLEACSMSGSSVLGRMADDLPDVEFGRNFGRFVHGPGLPMR